MNALAAKGIVTVLKTKATELESYLAGTGIAANGTVYNIVDMVDQASDQSYYGVPEAIVDDIKEATDLVVLSLNKIKLITDPKTMS